jgi:hypothetical protein
MVPHARSLRGRDGRGSDRLEKEQVDIDCIKMMYSLFTLWQTYIDLMVKPKD